MIDHLTWPSDDALRQIDVHELLPQQEPFVMVSRLVHLDDVRTICETHLHADNLFVEHGRFSASGLIESIAQTCAARMGYINKILLKRDVQIGFIGAIRNLEVYALPKAGRQITIIVDVKDEVFGITLASAAVKDSERMLMSTEIKIAIKQE